VCYASGVRIPIWLTLALGAVVIVYGAFRIYLGLQRNEDASDKPRRGLRAISKRAHLFVGVIYILLGAGLIATSFGFNPFGGGTPSSETAKKR